MMDLRQTIRARRAALRMTQKALALAAGVHHNTIYKFEAGLGTLPHDVLERVCAALDISLELRHNSSDPVSASCKAEFDKVRDELVKSLSVKFERLKFEHDAHDPQKLNFCIEHGAGILLVFFDGKAWGVRPWIKAPNGVGRWALCGHDKALMITKDALYPALAFLLSQGEGA